MLTFNPKNKRIILGSGSPRRAELLKALGFEFEIIPSRVNETFSNTIPILEVAEYLAIQKSTFFHPKLNEVIITADTVVINDSKVLGKPQTENEAKEMLQSLSGNVHQVVSAVCISSYEKQLSFSEVSNITFKELTEDEIHYYITNFSPLDKAGAYGIQEWIGMVGIVKMEGSFYNVMGLPCARLMKEISAFLA